MRTRASVDSGITTAPPSVRRRFIQVGDRGMHLRITGNGPPALFVHSSPASSAFVLPEMAAVADSYSCFAFDTPGFGLSDPLPGNELTVGDLADAIAEGLAAIAMPPCPVFGTHTGAAVALELASRHPGRVTGLVLDGLPSLTDDEFEELMRGDYLPDWPIDPLGGHFTRTWTRFRDQSTWYPWFARHPDALNQSDLSSPEAINLWVSMFFDATDSYRPAYRAALSYRGAANRLRTLAAPAILTAVESDMLYPHLDRLEEVRGSHQIRRVGNSVPARRALVREGFDRFGSDGPAPSVATGFTATTGVVRQFIDVPGGQLLVRSVGDPADPAVLLVHDLPGAGGQLHRRMMSLAEGRFVVAFDLPGCGESSPFDGDVPAVAALLDTACRHLGIAPSIVWGVGFGSSVAIEAAVNATLVVEGLLMAEGPEREELKRAYAPPIAIEPDGAHWYRTWLMLRDSLIWWPWFRTTRPSLRRVPEDLDARRLHDWTRETLRQPAYYGDVLGAVLDHDGETALARRGGRTLSISDSLTPLATAFGAKLAALPHVEEITLAEARMLR